MLSSKGAFWARQSVALAASVGSVCALTIAPPAVAQDVTPATAVIIDASASLLVNNLGGPDPIDAERQAITGLLEELPPEQQLALVAYGSETGTAPEEREAGCRDTRTVMPLGGDRVAASDQVRELNPRGYRPLGEALLAAERELPPDGPRHIVLVANGADTCAPPPACEVAKEIRGRGGDLVINVVGLNVDEQARGELQCIAQEGGGSYADASDAESLRKQLVLKSSRVQQKYKVGGVPVKGTREAKDAPRLDLGGLDGGGNPQPTHYQDVLPRNEPLHYKVKVEPGDRFIIGFITPPPAIAGNDVGIYMNQKIDIFDSTGRACAEDQWVSSIADGFSKPSTGFTVSKDVDEKDLFACKPGELDVVMSREGALGAETELPVEFKLWRLPHAQQKTVMPQTSAESSQSTSETAQLSLSETPGAGGASTSETAVPNLEIGNPVGPIAAAAGPSEAPVVQPGVYDAELASGDTLWFKVPAKEGQRVQLKLETPPVAADTPAVEAEDPAAAEGPVPLEPEGIRTAGGFLEWVFLNPVYAPVDAETFTDNQWQHITALFANAEQPKQAVSVTQPLTWHNAGFGKYAKGFLSGEQYVAIRYNGFATEDGPPLPLHFKVAVETQGQAQESPNFTYGQMFEDMPSLRGAGQNQGVVSLVVKVLLAIMALGFIIGLGFGLVALVRRKR